MVNTNIQSPIPLMGRGFSNSPQAFKEPGVYSELRNVVLDNGRIEGRPAIRNQAINSDIAMNSIPNPERIIGEVGGVVYYAGIDNSIWYMNAAGSLSVERAASVLAYSVAFPNNFHIFVGVYEYNEKAYFISMKHERDVNNVSTYNFYSYLWGSGLTSSGVLGAAQFLFSVVVNNPNSVYAFSPEFFRGLYIYKERLWITTAYALYASKATDTLNFTFTAGNGYFLRIRDQDVTCTFVNSDNIYVLSDNSINMLSYSVDPNTDSYVRPISSNQGALWGISHLGSVYVLSNNSLYLVTNGYLELLRDDFIYQRANYQSLDMYGNSDGLRHAKMVAFGKFIIIVKYDRLGFCSKHKNALVNAPITRLMLNNVFMYNTENGSMSVIDFKDQLTGNQDCGYIVDAYYVPGNAAVYFMTSRVVSPGSFPGGSYVGNSYVMYEDRYFNSLDFVMNTANKVFAMRPNTVVEMEDFAPDGNEYLIKKYRSLEFMGTVPSSNLQLAIGYDNSDYLAAVALALNMVALEAAGEPRFPYPFRISLMQRARSMSFKFTTLSPDEQLALTAAMVSSAYDYSTLIIEDMRTLWTYTNRGVATKSLTQVT